MKRALCMTLFAVLGLVPFKPALAQVAISVNFAPPALPVYDQPQCPEDGYLWVPGYWAWDADYQDYYWVPGTWVPAPQPGYLWTPPWWGWNNGAYVFNEGYWAPQVGFYGGVNYGFGYFGQGFGGGRWQNNHFYYNTAVVNVNTTIIRNVYINRTVIVNNNAHVSYNGGQGGIRARPTQQEEAVARMRHVPPPAAQEQRIQMARSNPQFRASANHGRPPVAATARPTDFKGSGIVPAKAAGAPYHPPANKPAPRATKARPGNERPPTTEKPTARPETHAAPARPETHPAPAHPETRTAPARPETHAAPTRPAPQERPAPAVKQPQERPTARPETTPRPTERTEHPAPESRPAPKTEPTHPVQRPAPRPKPESKPKPEEKKEPQ